MLLTHTAIGQILNSIRLRERGDSMLTLSFRKLGFTLQVLHAKLYPDQMM